MGSLAMITLRTGQRLTEQVWTTLREVQADLVNAFSQQEIQGLTEWARNAEARLRLILTRAELQRLVLTPRLLIVASAPAVSVPLFHIAISELGDAVDRWNDELREVEAWRTRWASADYLVAPDTNVYLHHPEDFDDVDWHRVMNVSAMEDIRLVLPMRIVDELDNSKQKAKPAAQKRAQKTLAKVTALFGDGSTSPSRCLWPATKDQGSVMLEILSDPIGHERLALGDDEIVDRLVSLQALADRPVRLATYDFGMAFRARQSGIRAIHLPQTESAT
jgi:hypothetical protein